MTYEAIAYPAALDRIFFVRRDLTNNTCAQLVVTHPYPASPTLITPADWGYQRSAVFDHPDACDPVAGPLGPVNMSWALEASGTVDWAPRVRSTSTRRSPTTSLPASLRTRRLTLEAGGAKVGSEAPTLARLKHLCSTCVVLCAPRRH